MAGTADVALMLFPDAISYSDVSTDTQPGVLLLLMELQKKR